MQRNGTGLPLKLMLLFTDAKLFTALNLRRARFHLNFRELCNDFGLEETWHPAKPFVFSRKSPLQIFESCLRGTLVSNMVFQRPPVQSGLLAVRCGV